MTEGFVFFLTLDLGGLGGGIFEGTEVADLAGGGGGGNRGLVKGSMSAAEAAEAFLKSLLNLPLPEALKRKERISISTTRQVIMHQRIRIVFHKV